MDLGSDLRRTSDDYLARLDELHALESLKRRLEPGSPDFAAIAARVRELSRDLFEVTRTEETAAELTVRMRETGSAALPKDPIASIPAREPRAILAEWRGVERAIATAGPEDARLDDLRDRADRLRQEYRRAFEERTRRPGG